MSCIYCSVNTMGEHEPTCPLYNKKETSPIDDFVNSLKNFQQTIAVIPPDEDYIERYIMLLSAYNMTIDILEVAPDLVGSERLDKVADFIQAALIRCIDEMVMIQETRKNVE